MRLGPQRVYSTRLKPRSKFGPIGRSLTAVSLTGVRGVLCHGRSQASIPVISIMLFEAAGRWLLVKFRVWSLGLKA